MTHLTTMTASSSHRGSADPARRGLTSRACSVAFGVLIGLLANIDEARAQPCANSPDINGDGRVDACDYIRFAGDYFSGNPHADLDCDGGVNPGDIGVFAANLCTGSTPAQPASLGTATIGVYADAAGTSTTWPDVPPYSNSDYYIVAHGVTADIEKFMFGLDFPDGYLTISPSSFISPAGFFVTSEWSATNTWLSGPLVEGDCLSPVDGTVLLARFRARTITGVHPGITLRAPDWSGRDCLGPSEFASYIACGDACYWTYFAPDLQAACSGQVYRDYDADCLRDPGEPGLAGRTIILDPGARAATTDANGWYYFTLPAPGQYSVRALPFQNWDIFCPATADYVFDAAELEAVTGLHFASDGDPLVHDVSVSVAGGRARQGRELYYSLILRNLGPQVEDPCTVTFTPPPDLGFIACSDDGVFDTITNIVTWTVSLEPDRPVNRTVRLLVPSSLPIGTLLEAQGDLQSINVDSHPEDNVYDCDIVITGPYDPNEKRVVPVADLAPDGLLSYQVHFQNVGNDTAFTVVVRDTLSPDLDMATVMDGAASHLYVLTKTDRELRWTFPNISLPDSTADQVGSNGFFTFTVRPVAGLPNTTVLTNRAAIYFDYNEPVITNFASTTFVGDPSGVPYLIGSDAGELRLASMPNPFNPQTTIAFSLPASARASLRIYDVSGRLVRLLLDEMRPAGISQVSWDGDDDTGHGVASGTYFARLEVNGRHTVRPLALVR